jgi:2,4-dienoyl-CoA reductase-like NADH-dependent reductase (Old Yellow Enzyme family)/thioredoxin reductase
LNHNGRLLTSSSEFKTSGGVVIGPSAVPHKLTGDIPQVMTKKDIQDMIQRFVINAKHAKMAGYDGVEIHGAHGYLINQFLSCYSNKRTDEYGGSLENRMRFALEIVREVRRAVGDDFVISFRLEAMEYNPGGVNTEEAVVLAKALETEGVDMLNVTAGNSESPITALKMFPPTSVPQGCYSHFSKVIKESVSIPVSVMGRIASPERAEEILEAGEADLVTIGRGLLADAHWVNKCSQGRREELRQCIGCLQGCYEQLAKEEALTCIYNPFVGREYQPLEPAKEKKKVWVVGGGPGGMEAARVAALRGHDVELFEAQDVLGGQVNIASIPPGKAEFKEIMRFYNHELKRLGVKVHKSRALTVEDVVGSNAQVVVLAVGSDPLVIPVPGVDQENVVSARDVLLGAPCGQNVVVCGGGLVGVETALFLDQNNKNVTLIEMRDRLVADAGPMNKARLLDELSKSSVKALTCTKLSAIDGNRVIVETTDGSQEILADTVVLALGAKARRGFEEALRNSAFTGEVYAVGDCVNARKILEAVAEGAATALQI